MLPQTAGRSKIETGDGVDPAAPPGMERKTILTLKDGALAPRHVAIGTASLGVTVRFASSAPKRGGCGDHGHLHARGQAAAQRGTRGRRHLAYTVRALIHEGGLGDALMRKKTYREAGLVRSMGALGLGPEMGERNAY